LEGKRKAAETEKITATNGGAGDVVEENAEPNKRVKVGSDANNGGE